jgi:CRISPR/Cas system-associated exonuclease Cas4 (RecB family)
MKYIQNIEAYASTKNTIAISMVKNELRQLSWNNIDLFLQCHRCFYNNVIFGIKRPGPDPESFKLSKTVEKQLKKEFDIVRGLKRHKIMIDNKIDAMPLDHPLLNIWRNSNYGKDGIRFYDHNLNITLFGAIDDIWVNPTGELIIVEYKTTSTMPGTIIQNNPWYESFKRQVSFYAWLFKKNEYPVSDIGYFIYCNGLQTKTSSINNLLAFEITPSSCLIDDSWIEQTITKAVDCLKQAEAPQKAIICKFCDFALKASISKSYPITNMFSVSV